MQGGFLPGDSHGTTTDSPSKRRQGQQSLTPVTLAQVWASEKRPDDSFGLDGKELGSVTFIARILSVNPGSTKIELVVEDGTDKIQVKMWEAATDATHGSKAHLFREGMYVRIVGNIRQWQQQERQVMAHRIIPVTDLNEITFHMLDVIYTHLQQTRGPVGGATPQKVGGYPGGMGQAHPMATSGVGYSSHAQQPYGQQASMSTGAGLSRLQNSILQTIRKYGNNEKGASFDEIKQELAHIAGDMEIKKELDFLSSECHVYTTINESYFKATEE